jgi:predicted phage-related endonuclease
MTNIKYETEAEWLTLREMHVGGSDIASLFYRWRTPQGETTVCHLYEEPPEGSILVDCVSPYKTGYRLWHEKAGVLMPGDFSGERIDAGTFLEPAIAAWSMRRWPSWKIRKVRRYIAHPDVGGWGASLDFEEIAQGMPPVEIKNVDGMIYREQWVEGDEGEVVMPPLHLMLQQQSQIGAAEADFCWIVACVGGNELKRGKVARHQPTQDRIAIAIECFWRGVRDKITPTLYADYETVSKVNAYGEKSDAVESFDGDPEMDVLLARHKRLQEHSKFLDLHEKNIKGRIAEKLGVKTRGRSTRYRMSWPVIEREEKLVPARLQSALTYRGGLTITKLKG